MRAGVFAGAALLLTVLVGAGLFIGSGDFSAQEVREALLNWGEAEGPAQVAIRDFRLPRTLTAVLVGMALGVAGVLMQTTARNPLADPGLLGVNAGAYLALVLGTFWFGIHVGPGHMALALIGAGAASVLVYAIGTRGMSGSTPAKLVLTGVAFGAAAMGIAKAIALLHPEIFDKVRHWSAGTLQGATWTTLAVTGPVIAAGLIIALLLPRALNTLLLGEESAQALGTSVRAVRGSAVTATTILAGAATAAAGPVSFVGLMVPHALRAVVGSDLRVLLPAALLAGPILVLSADILGRVILPGELPMGVVTAFIGAPVLILLARRQMSDAKVGS